MPRTWRRWPASWPSTSARGRRRQALTSKAVHYLLLAGDQARLAYAHREAIDYYSRALALQKEQGEYELAGRTLMKLGLVYHTSFDFAQARQAFEEGFGQWQQAGKRELPTALPPAPHALRIRWRCPYTLDPGLCDEYVSALVVEQMFSGLVSTAPDLDVVPEVAQRWQVLEGGRRYRFHLRPDARWSDGTPLTAHDFEYAWKRVLDPATCAFPPSCWRSRERGLSTRGRPRTRSRSGCGRSTTGPSTSSLRSRSATFSTC